MAAPIQSVSIQNVTENLGNQSTSVNHTESLSLENFLGAPSAQTTTNFQNLLQVAANTEIQGFERNPPPSQALFQAIDNIQENRKKIREAATQADQLSMGDVLELQETAANATLGIQLLNKTVSTVVKSVDSLTHMQ